MKDYIPRTLRYFDEKGTQVQIDEAAIADGTRATVVLGEPGMGKTWLLRKISEEHGYVLRSAAMFVEHPAPDRLVVPGKKLIIDGLDELAAAHESDPVYRVLGKLISAGCPPFILSCRAADWRGAVTRQNIFEEYGEHPRVATLEPLSRESAKLFLEPPLGRQRATQLIEYLDEKGIPDLYGNPLSLSLFGAVARDSDELPGTRAELLDRACGLLWREVSSNHGKSPLAIMDSDSALDAAGAVCAALILTGREAVASEPSQHDDRRTLVVADVLPLPRAEKALAVLRSRLFVAPPDAPELAKPVHRSIAEYLGARWLAGRAEANDVVERVLGLLTHDGGVPASLRGIHAWLPHFNRRFASGVIAADPYGLLRYGDADGLSVDQARLLLSALCDLQEANPYFRAEDWAAHSGKGLAKLELRDQLRELIVSERTTFHLRTLLLEAIEGTDVAKELFGDLWDILRDSAGRGFSYGERADALEALVAINRPDADWERLVLELSQAEDEDTTRLAISVLDKVGYEHFAAETIAMAVLGHLGLLESQAEHEDRSIAGALYLASARLPDEMLEEVLFALRRLLRRERNDIDFMSRSELGSFVYRLVARRIALGDPPAGHLADWLGIVPGRHSYSSDEKAKIDEYFAANDGARRAVQRHMLFRPGVSLWRDAFDLTEMSSGLSITVDDAICFLGEVDAPAEPEAAKRERWEDLASFAWRFPDRSGDVIQAAQPFVEARPELRPVLEKYAKPRKPAEWELKQRRSERHARARRERAWSRHRKEFEENRQAIEAGELRWVLPIAQAYLGLFHDVDQSKPPPERVATWLGDSLAEAALLGLEAVLHRTDLPDADKVSASYAQSRRWHVIYPLIAAFAERSRTGRGVGDLPTALIETALIGLEHEHLGDRVGVPRLNDLLSAALRAVPGAYEAYIRKLIEPQLGNANTYVTGLHAFLHSEPDRELSVKLAQEWALTFGQMPSSVEEEVLDRLVWGHHADEVRRIIANRFETHISEPEADPRRLRYYVATGLLVAFDDWRGIAEQSFIEPETLWSIRHHFGGDRFRGERDLSLVSPAQLSWIIEHFAPLWPRAERPAGVTSGSENAWDATEYLEALIRRLAAITTDEATQELSRLRAAMPNSGYLPSLKHAAELQRRARRELTFPAISLPVLKGVLESGPPQSASDLLVVVKKALSQVQAELRGSDTDIIAKYYSDDGHPRDEDTCTDRLIEDLERALPPGVNRVPQRDMPAGKRADIVFFAGGATLPVECKCQWNRSLWSAAISQLDDLYLRDWRADDVGLYLVFWFGTAVERRAKPSAPTGEPVPSTAMELRRRLIERIPAERRAAIAVEVMDFSR